MTHVGSAAIHYSGQIYRDCTFITSSICSSVGKIAIKGYDQVKATTSFLYETVVNGILLGEEAGLMGKITNWSYSRFSPKVAKVAVTFIRSIPLIALSCVVPPLLLTIAIVALRIIARRFPQHSIEASLYRARYPEAAMRQTNNRDLAYLQSTILGHAAITELAKGILTRNPVNLILGTATLTGFVYVSLQNKLLTDSLEALAEMRSSNVAR